LKEIEYIKITKDTKILKTRYKVGALEVGDVCELDINLRIAEVSAFNGSIKIRPDVAKTLINGGYAEACNGGP
jgi:hypothetical protein